MELPTSFAEVLKGMSLDDLKDLLEWGEDDWRNRRTRDMVQAEIDSREEN